MWGKGPKSEPGFCPYAATVISLPFSVVCEASPALSFSSDPPSKAQVKARRWGQEVQSRQFHTETQRWELCRPFCLGFRLDDCRPDGTIATNNKFQRFVFLRKLVYQQWNLPLEKINEIKHIHYEISDSSSLPFLFSHYLCSISFRVWYRSLLLQ